ncbi:hypothetical protein [Lentibacillus halophilus]
MKDLGDTHITTQYLGKINQKYDANASVFEYNKGEEDEKEEEGAADQ